VVHSEKRVAEKKPSPSFCRARALSRDKWPGRVGVGLFFGIVPIIRFSNGNRSGRRRIGLRLNKAITLLASNISIPPLAPFIYCFGLVFGHWIFTGERLEITPRHMTWAHATRIFLAMAFWLCGTGRGGGRGRNNSHLHLARVWRRRSRKSVNLSLLPGKMKPDLIRVLYLWLVAHRRMVLAGCVALTALAFLSSFRIEMEEDILAAPPAKRSAR